MPNGNRTGSAGREAAAVRRIVTSVGVSAVGTWSYNVGIAVYAYQQTGSTAWVAAATVGRYVPALLITWVGSRWADRWPRRTVAVASDVFCALMMVALTATALLHGPIVLAIGIAALSSGVARIQSAAALSAAADLVTESRLASTAALISTTDAVATAIGPAIAAVVLALSGPALLFALNGVTFAVSALLIAGVPAIAARRLDVEEASTTRADDSAYRASSRIVWPLLATRTVAAVVYGVDIVVLAVLATEQLKQGTAGYGWLLAGAGVGGLLVATWLRRQDRVASTTPRVTLGMAVYSLPLLAFMLTPLLPGSLAIQLVRGAGSVLVTATVLSGLQRMVPSRVSGRLFGLANILVMIGTCVGALVAPVLLGAWGLSVTLVVVAIVPIAVQLLLLPAMLRFDREGEVVLAELDPKVNVLRGLALFHDANRATLYDVADNAEDISVPADTAVVSQGEASDQLFVLLAGSVDVFVDGADGRTKVRRMEAPSYFGEIGLVHGVPRTATVVTNEDSALWSIPGEVFLWAASQAGLSGALSDNVTHRFGAANGHVIALPPTSL
jgi:CRP-like cAMP-binding protein/predicted MFS family arabinose efflux permease